MRKFVCLLVFLPLFGAAQSVGDVQRWEKEAVNVTIIRDRWGIPHVYGKTDANCVFGLLYAECEDDFARVETNYIEMLGRTSELKGETALYNDLLMKLMVDSAGAVADYKNAPDWLKQLLNAFADGVNYYLYKHPRVKPALLTHFQPWYPLMYTDGSIGAIGTGGVTADELKALYSTGKALVDTAAIAVRQEKINIVADTKDYADELQTGSNGFAFAPSKTASGNAILYINPHVTFYFRPEVHVISDEGLNAYGAVTWGQFFVYQGFNEHCGWMHTSSEADVSDAYIEKIFKKGDAYFYRYDNREIPVREKKITLRYKTPTGFQSKEFTVLFTGHGPVMANRNGEWLSVKAVNRSMKSLIQSWQRTKSRNLEDFTKTMELLSNMSNNTVYADDKGNIAYWHGNFMPRRDTAYDWSKPVDGSVSATEWQGLHPLSEIVQVHNPASGFIQNSNSTPFTVSGVSSPKRENYPAYMAPDEENYRAVNGLRLCAAAKNLTLDKVIQLGYNTYLTAFETLLPALFKAYDSLPPADSDKAVLQPAIAVLKNWNLFAEKESVATTLAVEWAQKLLPALQSQKNISGGFMERVSCFARHADAAAVLTPMKKTLAELAAKFGAADVAWGEINRYQRLTGNINEVFDDNKESLPVGFVSSLWGCLPSFNSRYVQGSKKRYGFNGNSFVCAVEFGKKITAKSLLTGGESGHANSRHFNDQAEMYAEGKFKDVLFYKEDILKNAEAQYHPGEERDKTGN